MNTEQWTLNTDVTSSWPFLLQEIRLQHDRAYALCSAVKLVRLYIDRLSQGHCRPFPLKKSFSRKLYLTELLNEDMWFLWTFLRVLAFFYFKAENCYWISALILNQILPVCIKLDSSYQIKPNVSGQHLPTCIRPVLPGSGWSLLCLVLLQDLLLRWKHSDDQVRWTSTHVYKGR